MKFDIMTLKDFYTDPYRVRKEALLMDYSQKGNYPGARTKPYLNDSIKNTLQNIVYPYGGNITNFSEDVNGSFQITYAWEKSWIHADTNNTWAGICYLTPDAPSSAGTGFFKHLETNTLEPHVDDEIKKKVDSEGQEYFRWELVQKVSNEFNKLVVYNGQLFHQSLDYFGNSLENGRLTQVFFFDTEYN